MTDLARREWRAIVLGISSGAGLLMCLALAAAIGFFVLRGDPLDMGAAPPGRGAERTGALVIAGGMALVGCVLIATLLAVVERFRARAASRPVSAPMRTWSIFVWLVSWLGASVVAQALVSQDRWSGLVPVFHLLAVAIPVFLLVRIATAGIAGGSRLRLWGSVSSGMVLSTGLAMLVEFSLLLLSAIVGFLYLVINPEQAVALQHLATRLQEIATPSDALNLVGKSLTSPVALVTALAIVAVITPVIEELAKSVPAWLISDRITAAGQGLWVGALAGAGFALVEGILVSSDATYGLGYILVLRAGSSLMHILSGALSGWGIGAMRGGGGRGRVAIGFAAATGLHSIWNAAVVLMVYGSIRIGLAPSGLDVPGIAVSALGGIVLLTLAGALPLVLIWLNRRFRQPAPEGSLPAPSAGKM